MPAPRGRRSPGGAPRGIHGPPRAPALREGAGCLAGIPQGRPREDPTNVARRGASRCLSFRAAQRKRGSEFGTRRHAVEALGAPRKWGRPEDAAEATPTDRPGAGARGRGAGA
jgi:hypothetical protein